MRKKRPEKRESALKRECMNVCSYCGKRIPRKQGALDAGVKLNGYVDLSPRAGSVILLHSWASGKSHPAIVAAEGSRARRDGNDLVFMTCSEECARRIRVELEKELELLERIMAG